MFDVRWAWQITVTKWDSFDFEPRFEDSQSIKTPPGSRTVKHTTLLSCWQEWTVQCCQQHPPAILLWKKVVPRKYGFPLRWPGVKSQVYKTMARKKVWASVRISYSARTLIADGAHIKRLIWAGLQSAVTRHVEYYPLPSFTINYLPSGVNSTIALFEFAMRLEQ